MLFSGKTIVGKHFKRGPVKTYHGADGKIISTSKSGRLTGNWFLGKKKGRLCIEWDHKDNIRCPMVIKDEKNVYKKVRAKNKKVIIHIEEFLDGDQTAPASLVKKKQASPSSDGEQIKPTSLVKKEQQTKSSGWFSEIEIKEAFSGKTVDGYHKMKEFEFKRYYDPNGTINAVSDRKGKRKGKWSASSIGLCQKFGLGKNKCRRIKKDGDVIKMYNKKGKNTVIFKKFIDGKKL